MMTRRDLVKIYKQINVWTTLPANLVHETRDSMSKSDLNVLS